MDDRALTAGISHDGLRSRREIKILICHIINSFKEPLNRSDIVRIIQREDLANYFETCDALESLIQKENICEDPETRFLSLTDTGREIASALYKSVPFTVREKALTTGKKMISRMKHEKQNKVELVPSGNGYYVNCSVLDGDTVLLSTSLYLPNKEYAQAARERFLDDPESLYRTVLAQLTDSESEN